MTLFNSPIKRVASTRKSSTPKTDAANAKKAVGSVAEPIKRIPFIVENSAVEENDTRTDAELVQAALKKNPVECILALYASGRDNKSVAGLLGIAHDSQEFGQIVRLAKETLQERIAGGIVTKNLVADFAAVQYEDTDGAVISVDVSAKAHRACVKALFTADREITVSLVKGASITVPISDALGMSADAVAKLRESCKAEYGKTFRTREVLKDTAADVLAMKLANLVK